MKFPMLSPLILSVCVLVLGATSSALTPEVRQLINYETNANGAGVRSSDPVSMPHIEIPIEYLDVDFSQSIDPRIAKSLIFERHGKKMVRWVFNPEDSKWCYEVMKHLEAQGLKLNIETYFTGYQTASRSYIVEDPRSGVQFSIKSSTDMTGGSWRDKKQPVGEAIDARLMSDYLTKQNDKLPFRHFSFMAEPAILTLKKIDQAIVVRDLGPLGYASKNRRILIPGFSALHEKVGREIALKNGSTDPYLFWTENYIKVAGRALGELAARTGLQFDSPHSQNFLVELDREYRPTGRLVLRDMSDLYIDRNFIEALEGPDSELLAKFTQKGNILDEIAAGFGPLHGNQKPSWVTEKNYSDWRNIFFGEYEKVFNEVSGYDLKTLRSSSSQKKDYFGAYYKLKGNSHFDSFFSKLSAFGHVKNLGTASLCRQAL